jgi:predicted DNA-binding transcriptional regulator YafY
VVEVRAPAALQVAIVNGKPEGWRARPAATPSPDRPDWIEGSFRFDSYDTAIRELLTLGPDVEILLPVELRDAMAAVGRRIARLHR